MKLLLAAMLAFAAVLLVAWPEPARPAVALAPSFERNLGQVPARFDYLARFASGSVALSATGAEIATPSRRLTLTFAGGRDARPRPGRRLPGVVNHLVGDDPARWRTGIPTYERVRYAGVWPGIDVEWHGGEDGLEYDFLLAPGADPGRIAVRFDTPGRVTAAGDLDVGPVHQRAPRAFQDGREVPAAYLADGRTVRIRVGAYDRSRPLLIDPVVIAYSTYLGGGAADYGYQIAVDPIGQAHVTGLTASANFNTAGAIEGDSPGTDAFVAKLNPAGNALAYATYLGGNADDEGNGIAVDEHGFAYVTGTTASTDFNTTAGALQGNRPGRDAFVAKLNPTGGDGHDFGSTIAVDGAGFAYVTGHTDSGDFPVVNAFQPQSGGTTDAFAAKLNPAGDTLAYSTYLGGRFGDRGNTIGVDSTGAAYIAGEANSADFPLALQHEACTTTHDGFVVKLAPAGDRLSHSTCIGGQQVDAANGLAVHPTGDVYVTGFTDSTDFDVKGPIEGDNAGLLADAWIAKLVFTSAPASPTPAPTVPSVPTPSPTPPPASGVAPAASPAAPPTPAPRPRPLNAPRRAPDLSGAPGAARTDAAGHFGYAFRAAPGARGSATFRHRGRAIVPRRAFTVPRGGRVALRVRLSRSYRRLLRRETRLAVDVRVTLRGGPAATRRLSLRAP